MNLNLPTLRERIARMTDHQLIEQANSEAFALADSSRLEGLILDQEKIYAELLQGYQEIRTQLNKSKND